MRVAEIQRFCTHDGPGVRTTLFFKGCPLRCVWCHNPETQKFSTEIMLYTALCAGCGACVDICPSGAQFMTQNDRGRDASLCTACGACAGVCPAEACRVIGKDMTPHELMREIAADAAFYGEQGGVTLSGGEPLCADGVVALLQLIKQQGLHVIVETAGACDPEVLRQVLPYVDEFYWDIKHTDAQKHRELTGIEPDLILQNLAQAAAAGASIRLRCLLVNGINTDDKHFEAVADLYGNLPGCIGVQLLRYHPMGGSKAKALGLADSGRAAWIPTEDQLIRAAEILENRNVPVIREE